MKNLEEEMSPKVSLSFQFGLEEFKILYMPFLDSLPDATILTELAIPSKIILANSLASKLFLYTQQEMTSLAVMDLFSDSSKELFVKNRALYEKDPKVISLGFKGVNHDYYGKKGNGEEFPLDRSLSPLSINGEVYVLSGFRDLTELKLSVSRLIAKEAAIDSERMVLQQQQDFMDTLCHELLNPLNGAYNSVDMLTSSFKEFKGLLPRLSPYDQEKFFNDIEGKIAMATECLEQQKVTVRDMLTITHLNNKTILLNLYNFELTGAIKELCNGFLDKLQRKNLKLILDFPTAIWLKGDKYKILQFLANLIHNSINSTDYGDIRLTINCDLTCCYNNDQFTVINFVLQDTRTGLLPDISSLFMPFGREQAVTGGEYKGSNLSLNISKKLIELMQGDIKVESQQPASTKFSFYIKCHVLSKEEIIETIDTSLLTDKLITENKEPSLNGKKILIVEDNKINMVLLNKILESTNCICYHAYDGEEAIEQFKRNRFDLIFMDIGLPKLNGIEVANWIRQQESLTGSHTPIVCLSAFDLGDGSQFQQQNPMMDEYIAKPYTKESIFEVVAKYILLKSVYDRDCSATRQELFFSTTSSSASSAAAYKVTAIKSTTSLDKVTHFPSSPPLPLENRASVSFNRPISSLSYYNNSGDVWSHTSLNTFAMPAPQPPINLNPLSSQIFNPSSSNIGARLVLENSDCGHEQSSRKLIKKTRTCLIL